MIHLKFWRFFETPLHSGKAMAAALFIASYILVAINSGMFFTAFLNPQFPVAYTFTLALACLITFYIYKVNGLLERKLPYRQNVGKRLKEQILWGIIFPVFTELLFVSLYFWLKDDTTILENNFFDIDFVLILIFIFLLNAFYIYALDSYHYKLRMEQHLELTIYPAMSELDIFRKRYRLTNMRRTEINVTTSALEMLDISDHEIACICKIDKEQILIFYFDGSQKNSNFPLSRHFATMQTGDYFMINPYSIFHRLVIYSWQPFGKSRQLWLILRHPFNRLNHEDQRLVSQGNAKSFRLWFDQPDEPFLSQKD